MLSLRTIYKLQNSPGQTLVKSSQVYIDRLSYHSTHAYVNHRDRFSNALEHENKVATVTRIGKFNFSKPKNLKNLYAVLVSLCRVNGVPSMLYTVRSSDLKSHSGQVSWLDAGKLNSCTTRCQHDFAEGGVGVSLDKRASLAHVMLASKDRMYSRPSSSPFIQYIDENWRQKLEVREPIMVNWGACDPTDRDVVHAALRETEEEIGVPQGAIDVWAVMPPIRRGPKIIYPVIGDLGNLVVDELVHNQCEVSEVFTVPLEFLCDYKNYRYTMFIQAVSAGKNRVIYQRPVFLTQPRVWGLTAVATELFLNYMFPDIFSNPYARHSIT